MREGKWLCPKVHKWNHILVYDFIEVMHTLVAIHCSIRGSSAENHGSGVVSERTSGQLPMIRPNSLTLSTRIGHTESRAARWNRQHAVLEPQVPHRYRWQVNNPHLFQEVWIAARIGGIIGGNSGPLGRLSSCITKLEYSTIVRKKEMPSGVCQ